MIKVLLRVVLGLACAYAILCVAVRLGQKRMLYFPDRSAEIDAVRRGEFLGVKPWRDAGGALIGWRRPRPAPAAMRVLIFHGNAGDALDRSRYLALFDAEGYDVVLFEYPGYGPRPGLLGQEHLLPAAQEAFRLLRREGPVLLFGESLGSGVAAQVAGSDPTSVNGLLLVTPFIRMGEVGARHYPWLPVDLLLKDRWDSGAALKGYRGPVAIVVAGHDEVVGAEQGRRLAAFCGGPVRVFDVPEATHNGLVLKPGYDPWAAMLDFVRAPR